MDTENSTAWKLFLPPTKKRGFQQQKKSRNYVIDFLFFHPKGYFDQKQLLLIILQNEK